MTSERIEPGAEAARRDDLARDVARLWIKGEIGQDRPRHRDVPYRFVRALDRLADAYGLQ